MLNGLARDPIRSEGKTPNVINAEAVFKAIPRDRDEPVIAARADDAGSIASAFARVAVRSKPAANAATVQARRPVDEPVTPDPIASASPPLPIVPPAEQLPPDASAGSQNTVMGTLRGATASLQRLPQRMADSMSSWFAESEPPRPPASIPLQEFRASM